MKPTILALALVLVACGPGRPVANPATQSICEQACAVLSALECKTSSGHPMTDIKEGVPCSEACSQEIASGVDLHPGCVAIARTCAQVDECSTK